ncbi:MAG: hypothetical protein ACREKK_00485, partial [Candidatus Methylomirabilales bacterium]
VPRPLAVELMPPRRSLAWMRYHTFCDGVRELAVRFKYSCTSWGRTPARNAAQPDSEGASQHLEWTAVDVVFDAGMEPAPGVFKAAAREWGLEAVREGDHWHLELYTTLY